MRRLRQQVAWRLPQANTPLVLAGIGCVVVAAGGTAVSLGGVSAKGLTSWPLRLLLLAVGLGLLIASLVIGPKPPPPSPPRGFEFDAARAFEASWCVMRFVTRGTRPDAVIAQLTVLLDDLDVTVEGRVRDYLDVDDDGASPMSLLEQVGGQLLARQPALVPYFEAGCNLLLDVARTGGQTLESIVRPLELPPRLADSTGFRDNLTWANAIHGYFEAKLLTSGR